MIVELELEAPPRHVLEEADIDAAIEPDGGRADGRGDGATGFSLVTADGRSSLGSTFLPREPDPRDYEARSAARRRPLRAGDRGLADPRACGPAPGRSRSTGGRSSAPVPGRRWPVHRRRPRAVGDLDRAGLGGPRRGARPRARPDPREPLTSLAATDAGALRCARSADGV